MSSDIGEEGRAPRIIREPLKPTKREIDDHNAIHVPFRDWCPYCVKGAAPNRSHRALGDREYGVPHVVSDYCFMGDTEYD